MHIEPNSIIRWLHTEFGEVVSGSEDFRVNCPFCTDDTKHHLYVSIVKPVAHCFRCEWGGSHFSLVKQVTGAESYAEVLRYLDGQAYASVNGYETVADRLKAMWLTERSRPKNTVEMPDWFVPFPAQAPGDMHAKMVLKYALGRLSANDIIWHDVGYCSDVNEKLWNYRVIFPIERGFFQGRLINNNGRAKYLSPKMEKEDRLFNYAALDRHQHVYIAEGIISALALGSNAIAVIGKAATDGQAFRIANSRVERYTIAFDADTEFSKGITDLADRLVAFGREVVIRQYAEGDPDSCQIYTEKEYNLRYKVFAGLGGQHRSRKNAM